MAKFGPTDINEDNWLYDEPDGLLLVHQVRDKKGAFIQCDQITVPWHVLRSALYRRDKRKLPRARKAKVRR